MLLQTPSFFLGPHPDIPLSSISLGRFLDRATFTESVCLSECRQQPQQPQHPQGQTEQNERNAPNNNLSSEEENEDDTGSIEFRLSFAPKCKWVYLYFLIDSCIPARFKIPTAAIRFALFSRDRTSSTATLYLPLSSSPTVEVFKLKWLRYTDESSFILRAFQYNLVVALRIPGPPDWLVWYSC